MRRRLSWIARTVLCCHLALLAAAPVSLLAGTRAVLDEPGCTCVHTGSAQCPMHHPSQKPKCQCRNTADPDAAAVVSLLGPVAVLAPTPALLSPPAISKLATYPISNFDFPPSAPDGPPPRA